MFAGNTADPSAFIEAVQIVRTKFGLTEMVMVGDRGMITSVRIAALRTENTESGSGLGWLTALRAPAIKSLAVAGGPLQPTLIDAGPRRDQPPRLPRRTAHRVPQPVPGRRTGPQTRRAAHPTEDILAPVLAAVAAARLSGADQIGLKVGKVVNTYKMAKHFEVTITETTLALTRRPRRSAPRPPWTGST